MDAQRFALFTTSYVLSCLMFVLESCKRPSKQAIQLDNDDEVIKLSKKESEISFKLIKDLLKASVPYFYIKHLWKNGFQLDEFMDATLLNR